MNHLLPDELIDAVEETLAPARAAHLRDCPRCAVEVAQLTAVLRESRAADAVPEPSPLFWDHLSARVGQAIAAEPVAPRVASWWQWPVLAPLAALATLVFVLLSAVPREPLNTLPTQVVDDRTDSGDAAALGDTDDSWEVLSELLGDLDIDTAQEAGIAVGLGSAEGIVVELSSWEQQELVRLLRAELQRAGG